MERFKNKYRIPSARLQGRDYSLPGKYFITICVKNREHAFGKIQNGKMILSDAGTIVYNGWLKTPALRKNVKLDAFQIMPNQLHGIIIITHRIECCTDALHASPGIQENELNSSQSRRGACNAPLREMANTGYKNKFGRKKIIFLPLYADSNRLQPA